MMYGHYLITTLRQIYLQPPIPPSVSTKDKKSIVAQQSDQIPSPKFGLRAYSCDYFTFENPKLLEKQHGLKLLNAENLPITFDINVGVLFDSPKKIIQILVRIKIVTFTKDNSRLMLAEMICAFDYYVENYNLFLTDLEEYNFPGPFLDNIANISISTSRGLLSSKLNNTYLQNLVMPLLLQAVNVEKVPVQ